MTKLAPARAAGFVMGVWFLSISIGDWLAGRAGSLFESMPLHEAFWSERPVPIVAAVILALSGEADQAPDGGRLMKLRRRLAET